MVNITLLDDLLDPFKPVLGREAAMYRNHVRRVYLNCLLLDQRPEHTTKYAIAAVFHDIGIWTDDTIDYLNPSIGQAVQFLKRSDQVEMIEEISLMINWHHKLTSYSGPFMYSVETFRKADLMDVSAGLFTNGIDSKIIRENRALYPNLGFHRFLTKKIFKNLVHRPWRPLPMFRL